MHTDRVCRGTLSHLRCFNKSADVSWRWDPASFYGLKLMNQSGWWWPRFGSRYGTWIIPSFLRAAPMSMYPEFYYAMRFSQSYGHLRICHWNMESSCIVRFFQQLEPVATRNSNLAWILLVRRHLLLIPNFVDVSYVPVHTSSFTRRASEWRHTSLSPRYWRDFFLATTHEAWRPVYMKIVC